MAGFLTSNSVSLDNGSSVVNITGSVNCSNVVSGTAVFINGELFEGVSGTASDPSGNSTITLRSAYTGTSIINGTLVAFNTIEGLRDAIQRARDLSTNFTSGTEDINDYLTQFNTFITSISPSVDLDLSSGTVSVEPYGYLLSRVSNLETDQSALLRKDDNLLGLTNKSTSRDNLGLGTSSVLDVGVANGVASLDGNGKVPLAQINDSILGQVEYKGLWNPSNNTPTLPNTPTEKGHYYICSATGTQFGITFATGDWIISSGTGWGKVDNTDAVSSVQGRTGNVVLTADDVGAYTKEESDSRYSTSGNVSSIKALVGYTPVEGQTVEIRGFYAGSLIGGGNFVWSSTTNKSANNGGTIITPEAIAAWDGTQTGLSTLLSWTGSGTGAWVRIAEVPLVEHFGGTASGDSKLSILKCHDLFEFMATKAVIKTSTLTGIDVTKPIVFKGFGVGEFQGFGTTDIISETNTSYKSLTLLDVKFSLFRRLINTGPSTSNISCDFIVVNNCTFEDCSIVLNCQFRNVNFTTIKNNIFKNMISADSLAGGMILGQGTTPSNVDLAFDNVNVANNVFETIYSGVLDQEAHAIMVHGRNITITANSITGVRNLTGSSKNAEAIYVKGVGSSITNNTITDGGFSTNGCIASKGALSDVYDPISPLGVGLVVTGNIIRYTDPTELNGNGVSIHMDTSVCNNNIFMGLTGFAVKHTNGTRCLDISHNTIIDHYGEQCIAVESNITSYIIAYNNIDLIGRSTLYSTVIFLQPTVDGTLSSGIVQGNKIYAGARFVGARIMPVFLNVPIRRTVDGLSIMDNEAKVSGAGSILFYFITLLGQGNIKNIRIERNSADVKSDSWCRASGVPVLTNITKNGNECSSDKVNTSYNLFHGRDECRYTASGGNYTLSIDGALSPAGIHFEAVVTNSGSSQTINLTNGLTFIDGTTSMVLTGVGHFSCRVENTLVTVEVYRGVPVFS